MAVPDNAIAFLEFSTDVECSIIALVGGDHVMHVYGPPMEGYDPNDASKEHVDAAVAWAKSLRGLVETLMISINFNKVSKASLTPASNGGYKLIPTSVSLPNYSPLPRYRRGILRIDCREIRITRWRTPGCRRGLWRGREVETVVAISPGYAARLSRMDDAMEWLSAANLEDLFYPLLGYLTYEGEVVGFVTEPLDGESLESPNNLSLIYDMFQRLESNHLFVIADLSPWQMQVKDGKIRMVEGGLDVVLHWSKMRRKERLEAREQHWAILDNLEHMIITFDRYGTGPFDKHDPDEVSWHTSNTFDKTLRLVAYIPAPQHPLTDAWVRTVRTAQRSTMGRHRRAMRSSLKNHTGIAGSTTSRIEELDSTSSVIHGDDDENLVVRSVRLSAPYQPYRRGRPEQQRAIYASSSMTPSDASIGAGSSEFD
ncbi:hypothetical protein CYLTODRAFT_490483 [Cylindrobasidium torrendii FP15055 ss-10]|uniref:Uncharacterized protein n=1 Tax=Cylindrobasidium torrendii FP15055 ss-10 TaxID=1314674 RepID=A0A0D7BAS3_9AGAR|nr:hypothetical protein CYLTODRAFT_490483 [Cylindrobasidium torrendii FP15055 ss-10]